MSSQLDIVVLLSNLLYMIKYKVTLTKDQHDQLMGIIDKGVHRSQQYRTAYILLNSDEGEYGDKMKGKEIRRAFKVSMRMIDRGKTEICGRGV